MTGLPEHHAVDADEQLVERVRTGCVGPDDDELTRALDHWRADSQDGTT